MDKVTGILKEVAARIGDAWSLDQNRVLLMPRSSEIPQGSYASYRFELTNGRYEAGAFDVMLLRIDIAAELPDPGATRTPERLALMGALRDRLTPTFADLSAFPEIPGWEVPVVTESAMGLIEDDPGFLLIGFTIEGEVTLPRGGYCGHGDQA